MAEIFDGNHFLLAPSDLLESKCEVGHKGVFFVSFQMEKYSMQYLKEKCLLVF